jgi:UDP-N-acetylmuramoyl-L-alanyl-D-glutamate--2,6-diaminopimelate ligase
MQLAQLLADLPRVLAVSGLTASDITRIVSDSRQVTPGALFVAYQGVGLDGHRFIPDAIGRGAAAIVGEQTEDGLSVPYIQVTDGREALGWLMAAWYGHPSRAMALVGVTGTDGKTTTTNLLFSMLRAAGRRAGLVSTINALIGGEVLDTGLHTTTPDAPDVQRYLASMRDALAEVAVLEVTSHGLAQQRVAGCAFDVAVVTNVTHEHLDFHGSYEEYRDAKAMLFRSLSAKRATTDFSASIGPKPGFSGLAKTAVLNRDDSSYGFLAAIPVERTITYGLRAPQAGAQATHLTATNIRHLPGGSEFEIQVDAEGSWPGISDLQVVTSLLGDFNVSNILAASGAALALGLGAEEIRAGVQAVTEIPGRMERIHEGQPFTAIVDFAHTPNALERALETLRRLAGNGRLIVVFGCAGLRDWEKRHLMGAVAARLADYTVITAEDPRSEDLDSIMAETAAACLAAGRVEGTDFSRVADRQRAITHAVEQAHAGDVVVVCGKGHEQSMCFGRIEYPWRDQDALRWALARLQGMQGATDANPPFVLPTWKGTGAPG